MASQAVKTARQEVRESICGGLGQGCWKWIHSCTHVKKGSFQQSLGDTLTGAVGGVAGAYTAGLGTDVASGLTSSLLSQTPLGGGGEGGGVKGGCAAVAAYVSGSGPLPEGQYMPGKGIVPKSQVVAKKAAKIAAALAATVVLALIVLRARR